MDVLHSHIQPSIQDIQSIKNGNIYFFNNSSTHNAHFMNDKEKLEKNIKIDIL